MQVARNHGVRAGLPARGDRPACATDASARTSSRSRRWDSRSARRPGRRSRAWAARSPGCRRPSAAPARAAEARPSARRLRAPPRDRGRARRAATRACPPARRAPPRRARLAGRGDPLVEPVDRVLDPLEPLRHRPQPAGEALDVGSRRDAERAHRGLLRLDRLLARLECAARARSSRPGSRRAPRRACRGPPRPAGRGAPSGLRRSVPPRRGTVPDPPRKRRISTLGLVFRRRLGASAATVQVAS